MKQIGGVPLPIVLVIASFLAPTELSLFVAGLRLPMHRIVLLIFLPMAIALFSSGKVRWRPFDTLFAAYNIWTVAAFMTHGDGTAGLVFGGSLAVESGGAYYIARAYIRDERTLNATVTVLLWAVVVAVAFSLPEFLLAKHFTHDMLQSVTGYALPRQIETRMGLTRAYGLFDHPIHLGSFCASVLALAWFTSGSLIQGLSRVVLIVVSTMTAISSAPLLSLGLQFGMIAGERVTRGIKYRLGITMGLLVLVYIIASFTMSRSPFAVIATGFTIDSWTGYYRLLIWQYGLENVWNNPVIGLGLGEWVRPDWMPAATVDAFWLLVTMRAGIPAFILLVAAYITLIVVCVRTGGRDRRESVRQITRAWLMSLVALTLLACTVHYWNITHAYFFFIMGMGSWLADLTPASAAVKTTKAKSAAVKENPWFDEDWQVGSRPAAPVWRTGAGQL